MGKISHLTSSRFKCQILDTYALRKRADSRKGRKRQCFFDQNSRWQRHPPLGRLFPRPCIRQDATTCSGVIPPHILDSFSRAIPFVVGARLPPLWSRRTNQSPSPMCGLYLVVGMLNALTDAKLYLGSSTEQLLVTNFDSELICLLYA